MGNVIVPGRKTDNRPSIFIGMPTMGYIRTEHLMNIAGWFVSGKYRLAYNPSIGKIPHDRARNIIAKEYVEKAPDFEYIMWMDAKSVPNFDILDKLLEADVPMISATAQTFKESIGGNKSLVPTSFRWDKERGTYKTHIGRGVEEVDVTHVACTLVKREVMEEVARPWFAFDFMDKDGTVLLGEEFSFCRRVKEAGFKIYNHYDTLVHHFVDVDSAMINHLMVRVNNGAVKATYEAMKNKKDVTEEDLEQHKWQ